MKRFLDYFRKRGFTLAEALVVTILVGYCMVPIVGTLQTGINRTEGFDHKEKLRNLARSRLNKEVSVGAFDLKSIDSTPSYHYVFYTNELEPKLSTVDDHLASDVFLATNASGTLATVSSILYSYKTEVEIRENLIVESENAVATYSKALKGLKALVVKSELEYNDNVLATDSVSFFSLLNIPSFSDEYLWVCNPSYLEVYAIDPVSKTKVETFNFPVLNTSKPVNDGAQDDVRPIHLALHPNRKWLVAQGKRRIFALNINRVSTSYGNVATLMTETDEIAKANKDNNKDEAMKDRGIAFRPDGKYFFCTYHKLKQIRVYKVTDPDVWPPTIDTTPVASLDLKNDVSEFNLDSDQYSDLTVGHDGWLYLAIKDKKAAIRFPMYTEFSGKLPYQIIRDTFIAGNGAGTKEEEAWAIESSRDGRTFYVLWKDSYITRYDSESLAITGRAIIDCGGVINDFILSGDDQTWAFTTDIDNAANSGLYFLANSDSHFTNLTTTNTVIGPIGAFPEKTKTEMLCLSPVQTEVIGDAKDLPNLYFIDFAGALAGNYTKASGGLPAQNIVNIAPYNKAHVSFTARYPQYALIGCSDGANRTVEYLDIYNQFIDESKRITLPATPFNIAISPLGDKFKVAYGPAHPGMDRYKFFNSGAAEATGQGASYIHYLGYSPDRQAGTNDRFASMDDHTTTPSFNGFWNGLPEPAGLPNYKDPSDSELSWMGVPTSHRTRDLEILYNGGYLMLFVNQTNGYGILDWIGMHQSGPDKGKFERFARWRTEIDNFPPRYADELAISADDGFLAIQTTETPNRVYIYDFNANNFGNFTQTFGLLADYRKDDYATENSANKMNAPVATNCSFKQTNPTLNNGIKLMNSSTASDTWRSHKDFPGNYYYDGSNTNNNGIAGNDNRKDASKRFIGYYIPALAYPKLAVAHRDPYSFFLDHTLLSAETNISSNLSTAIPVSLTENKIYPFQINHKTYGGERLVGVFTHSPYIADTMPAAPTTVAGDANYDDDYNDVTSFERIASTSTRPFLFKPVFLNRLDLFMSDGSAMSGDGSYMTFNRDASDPILFIMTHAIDEMQVWKMGKPKTIITMASYDQKEDQICVSDDGQRLIVASEDTGNPHLKIFNIADPQTFSFPGGNVAQSSLTQFGSLFAQIALPHPPTCLTTKPYLRYFSAAPKGNYESVATMTTAFATYGNGNAAVASGGIYIMAGNPNASTPAPTKSVLMFRPHEGPGTNVASAATGVLNKAVYLHSTVAYDEKVYVFNGFAGAAATDWVQSYDVNTSQVRSSYDATFAAAATTEIQVNKKMTASNLPTPASVSETDAYVDVFLVTFSGWKAFDGDKTTYGKQWASNSAGQSVTYDAGNPTQKFVVNKIAISNYDIYGASTDALKDFEFYGDATLLLSDTMGTSYNTTKTFTFSNSTPYQTYTLKALSRMSGTGAGQTVSECEFYHTNIRKVSPTMSGYSAGPVTVSASHDGSGEAWRAFDGGLSNFNEWDTGDNSGPYWLKMDLGSPDNVNIVRIYSSDDGIKTFSLSGSNNDSTYTPIAFYDGSFSAECPNNTGWQVFYFNHTAQYQYYKLDITDSWGPDNDLEPWEIEFYSTESVPTPVVEPYMTKTLDDNRAPIKLRQGAACLTPFGIVVAGGCDATGNATSAAMVYWPHGIDSYTSATDLGFGISRSIPPVPTVSGHCLVWHKGKLYRVGGSSSDTKDNALYSVAKFDFDTNQWTTLTAVADADEFSDTNTWFGNRFMPAACSHGNEIFIFGGMSDTGVKRIDGAAWNPERNTIRKLGDIPFTSGTGGTLIHSEAMTAVSYGAYIYLIGGKSGTSVGREIIKFSP